MGLFGSGCNHEHRSPRPLAQGAAARGTERESAGEPTDERALLN